MKKNYWDIWWPQAGYAHKQVNQIFEWICRNIRNRNGGPLIDCYDKYGPTEIQYETKFHKNESFKDYQTIKFNIRRLREIHDTNDVPHYCVARVLIVHQNWSSSARVYITMLYKGRVVGSDYQPRPPQGEETWTVYDTYQN